MAIEPLGSIMTVQAQPVQKVEAVQPVTGTEASAQAENVPDTKTVIVNKAEKRTTTTQMIPDKIRQAMSRSNRQ